jgi:hypothetical protein
MRAHEEDVPATSAPDASRPAVFFTTGRGVLQRNPAPQRVMSETTTSKKCGLLMTLSAFRDSN